MKKLFVFFILILISIAVAEAYSVNLTSGWNLVGQANSSGRNLSTLWSEVNATYNNSNPFIVISAWNVTNQSFKSFVNRSGPNGNIIVNHGEAYWLYISANGTANFTDSASEVNTSLGPGWNYLALLNQSGLTLKQVNAQIQNSSINQTKTIIWFNNTNKKYIPFVYTSSFNNETQVAYLSAVMINVNQTTIWRR